ncbi:glycerophosphodiester phosphodiesterase [Providencia hangzhouensis]|uniref:glycerophosphodiester phosphodiesterase n=2 Tax=Providencia hangzhouensis TaxID=3031799 RepID=UPI0034DDC13E
MKKIGDVTNTADKNGEFTNGNISTGTPPTILEGPWLTAVQREIINVLIKAGVVQNPDKDDQLATAIVKIASDVAPEIVQNTGASEKSVMSQKAVTDAISDSQVNVPDATTDIKGKVKLSNVISSAEDLAITPKAITPLQKEIISIQRTTITNNNIINNAQLELIAHRGFSRQFPQNTLLAFSMAAEAGATSLECDVQASTDGVLYVFHDLDVSALTNGTGLFREKSSAEINQLRFKELAGTIYSDMNIPTFKDVLDLVKERGLRIYAEFSDHMTEDNILEYIRLIVYYDAENNVTTQCFNNEKLLFLRLNNKNLELGFLRPTAANYESLIPTLQANSPAMFLMEMKSFLSDSSIAKKCRNANVGLAVWGVMNSTEAAQVMKQGCNRIVSDVSLTTKK